MNLNLRLQPKQIQLYNYCAGNEFSIIGYGGSAGGAKSHAIRDVALILASELATLKVLIIRRISTELTSNHINPFFQKYPELRNLFNKTERILYLPNGSTIHFGSSNNEDDIYSFQGAEYDLIFIDEATHFTQAMIEFLMTRNRSTINGYRAKTSMTMNPGGIGHAYIKRIFIDKQYTDNEIADNYVFIQAKISDNVLWCIDTLRQKGHTVQEYYEKWTENERMDFCLQYSEYAKRLSNLPEELKRAYLDGDWEVFGGQFFKTFDKKKQIIEPFEIPEQWKLIGAIDPGFSSPCSFQLQAQDYSGNIYNVVTYYEEQRPPEEHASAIKELILNCQWTGGRMPSLVVSGRDAFAKKDRYSIIANERTFADVFLANGIYLTPAVTDRILGWWTWKSLMPDRFFIFKGLNDDLVREMEGVISDSKRGEDIQGRGNDEKVPDHALDCARYGIMSLFKPFKQGEKPKPRLAGEDYYPIEKNLNEFSQY